MTDKRDATEGIRICTECGYECADIYAEGVQYGVCDDCARLGKMTKGRYDAFEYEKDDDSPAA